MAEAAVDFDIFARMNNATRSFRAGEVIFSEGDPAEEMFVVQSGEVEIRLGNHQLDTVGEKSIFGELALIDDGPRRAAAVAVSDVTLVPVSKKQFVLLVGETPYLALNVMRVLARRLRRMNKAL